jgi:uncharacterized phage-associated protein
MENPIAVANFFIQKSIDTGKPITPMKLVKLVYIAHGWHLGLTGDSLLPEAAQAWKYGPVIPSVYHAVKHYENSYVAELQACPVDPSKGFGWEYPIITNPKIISFLEEIWSSYKDFTALQLSAMTHQIATPWYRTWYERGGKDSMGVPIANDLIEEHYKAKVASIKK